MKMLKTNGAINTTRKIGPKKAADVQEAPVCASSGQQLVEAQDVPLGLARLSAIWRSRIFQRAKATEKNKSGRKNLVLWSGGQKTMINARRPNWMITL
jgi:hypothetical protein